jgi:hypothetical protein
MLVDNKSPTTTRRIEVLLEGTVAHARLLDERAPVACDKLWKLLPISGRAFHSRLSGGAVYVHVDGLRDPAYAGKEFPAHRLPENFCSFLTIGTISYVAEIGELFFCYEQAQIRSSKGNEWAARIADFEGDSGAFMAALARRQHMGVADIRIARA